MKQLLTGFVLLFGFAISSWAATLTIPEEFVVERLNSETFSPSIFTSETELELVSGTQILVLAYKELFDDESEDHHQYIRSKPFVVLFDLQGQTTITLSYPKQEDMESAKEFATSPIITLVDEHQNELSTSIKSLSAFNDEVIKKSLSLTPVIIDHNRDVEKGSTNVPSSDISVDNLAMLKYWWAKASEAEKQAFAELISENK